MENLTLVIPAKNEKESLPLVLDELKKFNALELSLLSKAIIPEKYFDKFFELY